MDKRRSPCLLHAEEQILRAMSTSSALPELLNKICAAVDCQIGNVVSLVSFPGDDAAAVAAVARNAELCGLYVFCSTGVLGENREPLGSFETYCCLPRRPSIEEIELVERAACLAAIAINLHKQPHQSTSRIRSSRSIAEQAQNPSAYVN